MIPDDCLPPVGEKTTAPYVRGSPSMRTLPDTGTRVGRESQPPPSNKTMSDKSKQERKERNCMWKFFIRLLPSPNEVNSGHRHFLTRHTSLPRYKWSD